MVTASVVSYVGFGTSTSPDIGCSTSALVAPQRRNRRRTGNQQRRPRPASALITKGKGAIACLHPGACKFAAQFNLRGVAAFSRVGGGAVRKITRPLGNSRTRLKSIGMSAIDAVRIVIGPDSR